MCERCGHRTTGPIYPIPLQAGVDGLVCEACKETIQKRYGSSSMVGLANQLDFFPALRERLI